MGGGTFSKRSFGSALAPQCFSLGSATGAVVRRVGLIEHGDGGGFLNPDGTVACEYELLAAKYTISTGGGRGGILWCAGTAAYQPQG